MSKRKSNNKAWSGEGASQADLMQKDQCILLDENDNIIGQGSKYDSHVFSPATPRGQLHRAFSVFLFNSDGEMLIQQRAASKITFPNVWSNTCCSHPLSGYEPDEIDLPADVASGQVKGVKAAAIRKLQHELGISPKDVPLSKFKFLTRLHYWAADVVTHGPKSPWGEHEIDYILFIQVNTKKVKLNLNADEVSDVKYVTLDELKRMMKPASGLLWSPWFRIIVDKFLVHWWKDLNKTLTTDEFVDVKTIHRFDPLAEHMGGAGNAQAWLGNAVSPYDERSNDDKFRGLKQGGYGKIKVHEHSLISQLLHVDEVVSALWLKYVDNLPDKMDRSNESVQFCDDMLVKVSRSFAAVIQQLPKDLCKDILVFYLVLRALDTIEDDMTAFSGREHEKVNYLNTFYKTALVTDGWTLMGVGEGDERKLLENFHHVVLVFKQLPLASQGVIADITRRMGEGMASFVEKDLGQGTVTKADYNLYCHYVAGLIGEGLSQLFTYTGYELPCVAEVAKTLANTMGLFLQKTNIIRDYLEDYTDGRTFYPKEVWARYSLTGELGEFTRPEAGERAVWLLNDLITDALQCIPDCLEYMSLLQTEETFRFCAIPQVMAIATLAELYGNHDVFTGVVKIRKGLAAQLILETKSLDQLHKWFYIFAKDILEKVDNCDPSAINTREICNRVLSLTKERAVTTIYGGYASKLNSLSPVILGVTGMYLWRNLDFSKVRGFGDLSIKPNTVMEFASACLALGSVVFMLGYSIVVNGRKGLKKGDEVARY